MARTSVFREHIDELDDMAPSQPPTIENATLSSAIFNHFTKRVLNLTIKTRDLIQSYLQDATSLKSPCNPQQHAPIAEDKKDRLSTYRGFDAVEYILMPMYGPTPSELDGPGNHFYIQGLDDSLPIDKVSTH